MSGWSVALLGAAMAAVVSLLLAAYGPTSGDFWEDRYRWVNDQDHVGPVLEVGWVILNTLAVLMAGIVVFPETTRRLLDHDLTSPAGLIVAGVVAGTVASYCIVFGPREVDEVLDVEGAAFNRLPADTQERLGPLTDWNDQERADERRRVRSNYVVYSAYSIISFYLILILLWQCGVGLWRDFHEALDTRAAMSSVEPSGVDSVAAAQEQLELYYAGYRTYQAAMLDLALDLTAVLAMLLVLGFWVIGTALQRVYTQFAVSVIRYGALFVLVALPVFILICFFHLVSVSNEATSAASSMTDRVYALDPGPEDLTAIHDIEDRTQGRSAIETFWAKVASSSGGLLLLLGLALSIVQRRRSKEWWLRGLVPPRFQDRESELWRSAKVIWRAALAVRPVDEGREEVPDAVPPKSQLPS